MGDYLATILTDAPLFVWELDETSGTAAADSSGNSRPATYAGTPTLDQTDLILGYGSVELGDNDYVEADANLTFSAPYSLEVWGKRIDTTHATTYSALFGVLVGATEAAFIGQDVTLGVVNGPMSGWASDGTSLIRVNGSEFVQPSTTEPRHYVLVVDTNRVDWYIDGVLYDTVITDMSLSAITARKPRVGSVDGGNWFGGLAGWAAIYDTALTGARVLAHYQAANRDWPATDSGAATDSAYLTRPLSDVDSGVATDSASMSKMLTGTDSGTTTDTAGLTVGKVASDSGVFADIPGSANLTPTASDAGHLTTERARVLPADPADWPFDSPYDALILPAPSDVTPTTPEYDLLVLPAPSDWNLTDG